MRVWRKMKASKYIDLTLCLFNFFVNISQMSTRHFLIFSRIFQCIIKGMHVIKIQYTSPSVTMGKENCLDTYLSSTILLHLLTSSDRREAIVASLGVSTALWPCYFRTGKPNLHASSWCIFAPLVFTTTLLCDQAISSHGHKLWQSAIHEKFLQIFCQHI